MTLEHLLCVVNTELKRQPERFNPHQIRILDLGCGIGDLISILNENLPLLNPGSNFEIYGYEIREHGGIKKDYSSEIDQNLRQKFPNIDWTERVKLISEKDPIPFPDLYFDIIISNQVMEHVKDHSRLFSEIHRSLKLKGISIHLFPFSNIIVDPHINLPFVHNIINLNFRMHFIRILSKLGIGKYRRYRKNYGHTLDQFTKEFSDYFNRLVHYINHKEILKISSDYNLRPTYCYTNQLLFNFINSFFSKKIRYQYPLNKNEEMGNFYMSILKYFISITLLLDKNQISKD